MLRATTSDATRKREKRMSGLRGLLRRLSAEPNYSTRAGAGLTAAAVYFFQGRASRVRRRGRSKASRYAASITVNSLAGAWSRPGCDGDRGLVGKLCPAHGI